MSTSDTSIAPSVGTCTRHAGGSRSLRVRLRVLFGCAALDHALARGANPAVSAELSLRAARLVGARNRRGPGALRSFGDLGGGGGRVGVAYEREAGEAGGGSGLS